MVFFPPLPLFLSFMNAESSQNSRQNSYLYTWHIYCVIPMSMHADNTSNNGNATYMSTNYILKTHLWQWWTRLSYKFKRNAKESNEGKKGDQKKETLGSALSPPSGWSYLNLSFLLAHHWTGQACTVQGLHRPVLFFWVHSMKKERGRDTEEGE